MADIPIADAANPLKRSLEHEDTKTTQPILPADSTATKAEKLESNGLDGGALLTEPATKRAKLEAETASSTQDSNGHSIADPASNGFGQGTATQEHTSVDSSENTNGNTRQKVKGVALVKAE